MVQIKLMTGNSVILNKGSVSEEDLLQSITEDVHSGYVYAVFEDQICLGIYKDHTFHFYNREIRDTLKYLIELRIFNDNSEYRAVRVKQEFKWRIREDRNGEGNSHYLEEIHKVWGSVTGSKNGYIHLQEARGAQLYVPYLLKKDEKLGLCVRQYIHFSEKNYRFEDERFVGFVKWEGE